MEHVFIVVFWVKQRPAILGSFVSKDKARARVHEEWTRAENIYRLAPFTEGTTGDANCVYCIKNKDDETIMIVKVIHDNTEVTKQ